MTAVAVAEAPGADGVLDTLRQTPRPVRAVLVGTLVNRLSAFLQVFLVMYLLTRGYDAGEAGLALGAHGVGGIAGGVLGGWLADRVGSRLTMVLANAAAGVFIIGVLYATSLSAVLVAVVLVGLCGNAFRPAAAAALAEHTPATRYTMIFATQRLATNVGTTAGALLGALIVKVSYTALFWIEGTLTVTVALLTGLALPADRPSAGTAGSRRRRSHEEARHRRGATGARRRPGQHRGQLPSRTGRVSPQRPPGRHRTAARGSLGADWRFVLFLAGVLLTSMVYVQYLSTLPLHVEHIGHTASVFALLVAINGAIVVFFELPVTNLTQRWPVRPILVANVVLVGFGMALYWLPLGLVGLVLATLVWSLGEIVGAPTMFAYPARIAPPDRRGRYLGATTAVVGAAFAVGPVLGALGFTTFGTAVWPLCALVSIAAVAAIHVGTAKESS